MAAKESNHGEPLTGIYWWIPKPLRGKKSRIIWTVQPSYSADGQNDLEHVKQWPQVLAHLSSLWKKPLRGVEYAALPRGRVNYPLKKSLPVLYHGNDSPGSLELVRSAFNLSAASNAIYDDHERQIPEYYHMLVRLLGVDLGLRPSLEETEAFDEFTDGDQDSEDMVKKQRVHAKPVARKPETEPRIRKRPEEDRRARQAVRLANIMRVQELLLGRGRWNVKSLAAELECSEKTVHRHMAVLEIAGVPWYYNVHDRCYHVRPGFKFPVVNLSPDELLGQAAAVAITNAAGLDAGADTKPATRKIAAASSQEIAELLNDAEAVMEVLSLKLADHSRHQEMIRTAQWALIHKKQVSGQYGSPYQDRPVKLGLHPYRLCFAGQAWYLIARPVEEKSPKTYRLARFQSLRMIDAAAQRPDKFSLDNYFGNAWGVFRGKETFDVEIEFTPDAANLVTETRWHKTQQVKRHPDGRAVVSFTVDGLDEILWWVLGWSGRAKVLAPAKLREMVLDKLRLAIEINGG